MKTQSPTNHFDLRKKAEEKLSEKNSELDLTVAETNLLTLNHELQVHQIELEMQNDELVKAIDIADEMSTKYIDLYNLAPTGYISLTKEGEIIEANNSAYDLLGRKQPKLIGSRFGFFCKR